MLELHNLTIVFNLPMAKDFQIFTFRPVSNDHHWVDRIGSFGAMNQSKLHPLTHSF